MYASSFILGSTSSVFIQSCDGGLINKHISSLINLLEHNRDYYVYVIQSCVSCDDGFNFFRN